MHYSSYILALTASAAITAALPIPNLSVRKVLRLNDRLSQQSNPRDDSATRAFSNVAIKTGNGQCLFVDPLSGDLRANNLPVQVRDCDGSQAQQFDIITAGKHNDQPGTMLVVSSLTQGCLNVDANELIARNQVNMFSCGGRFDGRGAVSNAQLFQMANPAQAGAGPIQLRPMNAQGSCLTSGQGGRLAMTTCSNTDTSQAFQLASTGNTVVGAIGGGTNNNGGNAVPVIVTVTAPANNNNGNGSNNNGAIGGGQQVTVTVTAPNIINNGINNGVNDEANNGINDGNGRNNNGNGRNNNGNGRNNNGNGRNNNGNGRNNNNGGIGGGQRVTVTVTAPSNNIVDNNNNNLGGGLNGQLPPGFSRIQNQAARVTSTVQNAVGGGIPIVSPIASPIATATAVSTSTVTVTAGARPTQAKNVKVNVINGNRNSTVIESNKNGSVIQKEKVKGAVKLRRSATKTTRIATRTTNIAGPTENSQEEEVTSDVPGPSRSVAKGIVGTPINTTFEVKRRAARTTPTPTPTPSPAPSAN